jgi:thiamine biosynthesis lipoprotein
MRSSAIPTADCSDPREAKARPIAPSGPDSVSFRALGTTAHLIVTDPGRLVVARRALDRELREIDAACSRFRADSELSAVNLAAGEWCTVSALFAVALEAALSAARSTDGAVDPCVGDSIAALGYDRDFAELPADGAPVVRVVPLAGAWRLIEVAQGRVRIPSGTTLDFGATAKALAADRAAADAARVAECGVLVSLGGDVSVAGTAPVGGWRVQVTDDHAAGQDYHRVGSEADYGAGPDAGQTVAISAGALATSSTTVRGWHRGGNAYHHIVDPVTGLNPPPCWRTVSVAAASCVDANSASTAAIVRGERAAGWLTALALPARLVAHDGRVVTVAGWPQAGPRE